MDKWWFIFMELVPHLKESLWILELEHTLERFSIRIYLDWLDHCAYIDGLTKDEFPERFLNYLEGKVSYLCS